MTNQINIIDTDAAQTDFRSRSLGFYHPNSKGTGCAMRLEPRINRDDADRYNCFFIEMAPQKTTARRDREGVTPATFDWSRKITVKLNFLDVAELLTVLEGRAPHIGGERKGLYHASGGGNTLISFSRNIEQGTYLLALSSKRNATDTPRKAAIALSETEATGLRCLLQTGLFFVTFSSLMKGNAENRPVSAHAGTRPPARVVKAA